MDIHQLDRIEKKLDAIGRTVSHAATGIAELLARNAIAVELTAKLKASSDALAESVASAWQPIPVEPGTVP